MKGHGLFGYYSPPNFLFPFIKVSFSLAMWKLVRGPPWWKTPNCNSLLIPNKPICAVEIIFISGQQHLEVLSQCSEKSHLGF